MKYVDEYRNGDLCQQRVEAIQRTATRRWSIMEVCGGQTHGLLRYGIDQLLQRQVHLIHGPGCPVCVTPTSALQVAIQLAFRPGCLVTTFGDMLRVPGEHESLLQARGRGAQVRMVYSPLDALELARQQPDRQVVFLAVGFETTAPATALALEQARMQGIQNFSVIVSHVRVLPAMEQLAAASDLAIDGFLAAGHVCAVLGYDGYAPFVAACQRPVVVTGFEPLDLLDGILACIELLEAGTPRIVNRYPRNVQANGNDQAQALMDRVFEPVEMEWRGLGVIPLGGFRLRPAYRAWDAMARYGCELPAVHLKTLDSALLCRSGDVMSGRLSPQQCPYFGVECTPDQPLGAPMVSSEGACAAYYRYARQEGP